MLHTITNVINFNDTETQILKCKEIKHKMDVLQAEYDRIKKTLTEGYFKDNDEFIGSEGLVLATYKGQSRTNFKTTEFKKDHAKLYADYCEQQQLKVFLIKK
jgi:hypothetical protein